jgi:AcrR family transcriptional regulator
VGSRRRAPEPRSYHHGSLRRELLDAALRRFTERGTLDFTLRELARDVGVTHNAPYRHFATKAALLDALREEGFARLADAERAALARAGEDVRARVRALGEAYVRFALAEPAAFRLMLAHPEEKEVGGAARATESFAMLERALEEGRASGATRTDLSSRELALAAWSLVHGLSTLLSSGRLPASEARVRRYAGLLEVVFFEGVGPKGR